jgi:hypothetical protein
MALPIVYKNLDFCYLPLSFDLDKSEDPITTILPAGFNFATIDIEETDGSEVVLSLKLRYPLENEDDYVDLSSTKTDISDYAGCAVLFQATITDGIAADFLVTLTKN